MQQDTARPSRFPLAFELMVWALYVGLYKYNYFLEDSRLHPAMRANFPFPQLMLFAVAASLYVVPYYRWLLPLLLRRRRYAVLLVVGAILYLWWGIKLNTTLAASTFRPFAAPPVLADFYQR